MPAIDCGIDIGSTNVKIVFADDGRVLSTLSVPAPRVHDGLGVVTNPLALVEALEALIINGWRNLNLGVPLRSICAAGVGEDGIGVTAELVPTGFAIPWFDKRAGAEAELLLERYGNLSERAGIKIDATLTAAKWLWLRRNRPSDLKQAKCWITLTDFPAAWWTGNTFLSSSLAPRTACFDVYKRKWIDELLTAAQAPALPVILSAGDIVGEVRKGALRESGAASTETVVVAGGHDHPVSATMIRRFDPDAWVDSMGTANLIYGEGPDTLKPRMGHLAYSIPPSGSQGLACLGVLELSSILASVQSDANYLRTYLSQDRLPGSPPRASSELQATAEHKGIKIRRVLERVSLMARQLLDEMDEVGIAKGKIFATGGWSRSKAFVELRASVFGQPIHALGDVELTALGAAVFGAEAATGKTVCPFQKPDTVIVDPVERWIPAYQDAHDSFKHA
jgi:xylulokinase